MENSKQSFVEPKPFQQPMTKLLNHSSRSMPYSVPKQNHPLQPNNSDTNNPNPMVYQQQISKPTSKQDVQIGKGNASPSAKQVEKNLEPVAGPSGINDTMEIERLKIGNTSSDLSEAVDHSACNETSRPIYTARKTSQATNDQKMRVFTGSAEKLIKWHRMYKHYFCLYEVMARLISIDNGSAHSEKILILRDVKGPVLKVSYYDNANYIKLDDFFSGQIIRAVGRMIEPNKLQAICIRQATQEEISNLPRMCYISEHAITRALEISKQK